MEKNIFLKKIYNGSDSDLFVPDFIQYLQEIIETSNWTAMSDRQLFLDGAKTAINEIIAEINKLNKG